MVARGQTLPGRRLTPVITIVSPQLGYQRSLLPSFSLPLSTLCCTSLSLFYSPPSDSLPVFYSLAGAPLPYARSLHNGLMCVRENASSRQVICQRRTGFVLSLSLQYANKVSHNSGIWYVTLSVTSKEEEEHAMLHQGYSLAASTALSSNINMQYITYKKMLYPSERNRKVPTKR